MRVGIIGVGGRGRGLLGICYDGRLEVPALCDINQQNLAMAQGMVEKAGRGRPEGYSKDEYDFRRLVARDDLDAVIIATPWHWHTPMAVYGMKADKYVGVEVPARSRSRVLGAGAKRTRPTDVPCMMLENWSFRRDNLAVLNMIRRACSARSSTATAPTRTTALIDWFFDAAGQAALGRRVSAASAMPTSIRRTASARC